MKVREELNANMYRRKIYGTSEKYRSKFNIYAPVSSGDMKTVRRMLRKGGLSLNPRGLILSDDPLRNALYHFILAANDIAEVCVNEKLGFSEAMLIASLYIRKADRCGSLAKVRELFGDMCMDFTERMSEIRKLQAVSLHVRSCISHIYENLGADLSIKNLSKLAGLDPTYFSRLFRKETGTPLKRFVREARIDTAQNLLLFSDRSCSEIAFALGFSSQSKFIEAFKDIVGMTPKTYRDKYGDKIMCEVIDPPLDI